jgi:hypothetical protein
MHDARRKQPPPLASKSSSIIIHSPLIAELTTLTTPSQHNHAALASSDAFLLVKLAPSFRIMKQRLF